MPGGAAGLGGSAMTRVTQEHIDARMRAIRQAAFAALVARGVEGAKVQEIAQAAGLSAGAIYRYYPSKEDLLRAVFDEVLAEHQRLFDQAASGATSLLAALERVGREVLAQLAAGDPASVVCGLELALAAAREPEGVGRLVREARRAVVEMVERVIRQAQAAGEVDPALDPRATAQLLLAFTLGLGQLRLELGEALEIEPVFDAMLRMVRREAPTSEERG